MAVAVLNLAYIALLSSTFTRTLSWLRVMLVLGAAAFVVYGAIEGILSMVIWNAIIGAMHLVKLLRDLAAQRAVILTAEEVKIRDDLFPNLTDFDFNLLWGLGVDVRYEDQVIIAEGARPDTVSLVLGGVVAIESDSNVIRGVRRGGLIGEMSMVSGRTAEATVLAQGEVTMHQWEQRQILALDQANPTAARAFRDLMAKDLVNKART